MTDLSTARILLTGGAGFIGSALLAELNRRGNDRIIVADFLGRDELKWRHLRPLAFEDYVEAGNLFPRLESGELGSFDLVLHMGACSSTTEQNAEYLISNNYEYTKRLANFAESSGSRFVYASSAATYGDGSEGMADDSTLGYLRRLRPLNMYGYSKHLFDLFAAREGMLRRMAGLKYFNVFGPNEDHKGDMRSVVNKAFHQIAATGSMDLFRSYRPEYGDGEQRRDFLYVRDAVAMTLFLAESDAGGLFNIGSGEARTWNELANAVFAALGKEPRIRYVEMPEEIRPRYQYFTQADVTRLLDAGYRPRGATFAGNVDEYVKKYLATGKTIGD